MEPAGTVPAGFVVVRALPSPPGTAGSTATEARSFPFLQLTRSLLARAVVSPLARRWTSPISPARSRFPSPSAVNLDAYFARIGYSGPRMPTLAALRAIHAAHAEAIPFENLDVLLGRPISLEPSAVFQKLVSDRRGGYCFEQNILLGGVLRELGFQVTPLIARVRWQVPPEVTAPQTHMVLHVDVDGVAWLADAGFGGVGLTVPIQIAPDIDQGIPPEGRRLLLDGRYYLQQVRFDSQWLDVYRFALEPVPPIDFEVGNWYTSAHPKSRFRQMLMVARVDGDRRLGIQNREFIVRPVGRPAEKREIGSADELLALLAERFGLHFPAGTRFGPPGSPWPS